MDFQENKHIQGNEEVKNISIMERDRALHDKDRLSDGNREEMEELKREPRLALDRAETLSEARAMSFFLCSRSTIVIWPLSISPKS